jgi:hypothetical protein
MHRNVGPVLHTWRVLRSFSRFAAAAGLAAGLVIALGGCSSLSVSSNPDTIPTEAPTDTAAAEAEQILGPRPTPTASASPARVYASPPSTAQPTATKTKVKAAPPLFVASLPSTVDAVVGQRIVVQFAADAEDGWTASAIGGMSVGGVNFTAPPPEQPDAPGTTIAMLTVTSAGPATVTFTSGMGASKKLTVRVE